MGGKSFPAHWANMSEPHSRDDVQHCNHPCRRRAICPVKVTWPGNAIVHSRWFLDCPVKLRDNSTVNETLKIVVGDRSLPPALPPSATALRGSAQNRGRLDRRRSPLWRIHIRCCPSRCSPCARLQVTRDAWNHWACHPAWSGLLMGKIPQRVEQITQNAVARPRRMATLRGATSVQWSSRQRTRWDAGSRGWYLWFFSAWWFRRPTGSPTHRLSSWPAKSSARRGRSSYQCYSWCGWAVATSAWRSRQLDAPFIAIPHHALFRRTHGRLGYRPPSLAPPATCQLLCSGSRARELCVCAKRPKTTWRKLPLFTP